MFNSNILFFVSFIVLVISACLVVFALHFVFSLLFLLAPLFFEISYYFNSKNIHILENLYLYIYQNWYGLTDWIIDIIIYSQALYTYSIFQFLICGIILLLVLIGTFSLTNLFITDKSLSRNFKYVMNK